MQSDAYLRQINHRKGNDGSTESKLLLNNSMKEEDKKTVRWLFDVVNCDTMINNEIEFDEMKAAQAIWGRYNWGRGKESMMPLMCVQALLHDLHLLHNALILSNTAHNSWVISNEHSRVITDDEPSTELEEMKDVENTRFKLLSVSRLDVLNELMTSLEDFVRISIKESISLDYDENDDENRSDEKGSIYNVVDYKIDKIILVSFEEFIRQW